MVDKIEAAAQIPPPVPAIGGQSGHGQSPQKRDADERHAPAPVDIASVLGMADRAMAPAVQEAVSSLVEQLERLRAELERAKLHEAYLQGAADHHAVLPVLTRRAFLSGLSRLLEASARSDLPGTLALFHIGGIEGLREREGLAAGDAALDFVARTVLAELRQTDLIGYLDSSDFAIALAVAEPEGANTKIERIVVTLAATPLIWQERATALDVTGGVVHFEKEMTAESALAAADSARMKR